MDIQKMIDEYIAWLKSGFSFASFGEYYEITTPYLDCVGDPVQFYVKQEEKDVYFTDDGFTIANLTARGLKFTKKNEDAIRRLLLQYGVELRGKEIVARATRADFARKKHLFIQAILRVDDVFIDVPARRESPLFVDDVKAFLSGKEIFYTDKIQFTGRTGYPQHYDFVFQRSKTKPERLGRTINSPTKASVANTLFIWEDTKTARDEDSQLIVFLNDRNPVSEDVIEAFKNYDVKSVLWSLIDSEENLELLTA